MAIHELVELRDRIGVFRDRAHAGEVVAGMLADCRGSGARVFAIPAGGVPVAAALARTLELPLGAAVVSKITPAWNSEVGYGAIAFDGGVVLNRDLILHLGLAQSDVDRGIEETRHKVQRRISALRESPSPSDLADRAAILVDDGLASGFTMRSAVEALRRAGAVRIAIAVPTGSRRTVDDLATRVEELYCANVRGGPRFAVADAYQRWWDVDEGEAVRLLTRHREGKSL
jgi:predicted phosphoribosyltransferase